MGRTEAVRDNCRRHETHDASDRCAWTSQTHHTLDSSQMALIEDPKFKVWVEKYAADQNLFFKDFALAFGKLIGESPWHRVTG